MNVLDEKRSSPELRGYVKERIRKMQDVMARKGVDVTIPSRYKGKPVTAIDHAAFHDSAVTSVTIPDSVTSISDGAFVNCPQLTNISIPNSVTYPSLACV